MKTKSIPRIKTLSFATMDEVKRVPIREYLRHYKAFNEEINQTGEKIIITNQDEDTVMILPIKVKKRLWSIEEIRQKLTFSSDPDLSSKIDEIVYGK